jgi:type IV pilus assembly protein PilC
MPAFEYTAKDPFGNTISGVYDNIESQQELRGELAKTGLILLNARKQKFRIGGRKKIKAAEIVTFAFKFAGMYSAGLPIARCLEILAEQTENPHFKSVLNSVTQDVQNGMSLKAAFEKHNTVFSDFFLGMVEAGEAGGKLSETLEMAAAYLENQAELRHKVRAAFAYPIIVAGLSLLIVVYLVLFVVPIFSKLYRQLHVSLPGPTATLVILSVMMRKFWWLIIILGGAGFYLFRKIRRRPDIKMKIDEFKLKVPVFAKLNRMIIASRFIRTFAMMSDAGVPLIDAISVANRVANNCTLNKITENMQASIAAGSSISEPMQQSGLFPPMIVQMAAAGEEVGMVPEMLSKGADMLDKDIDRMVKSLLVKLEPVLTLCMGVIIGFILLGLYLPMFDYMSHLK